MIALLPVRAGLQLVRLKPRSMRGVSADVDVNELRQGAPRFTSTQVHRRRRPENPITEFSYLFVSRQRGLSFPTSGEQFPPVSPQKGGHETHTPHDPNIFVPEEALHGEQRKNTVPSFSPFVCKLFPISASLLLDSEGWTAS